MINISFFSYKGGAGRTSLLLNTLPYLAEKLNATEKEPIIVIDLDLDSKGLSYLNGDAEKDDINAIQVLRNDAVIGFQEQRIIEEHPFFKNLKPIGKRVGLSQDLDRSILFVTAHPKEGAASLSENGSNYDYGSNALRGVSRLCRESRCKAIVMDCPAGDHVATKASLSIANKIVCVMRITQQFRMGTEEFLSQKSRIYKGKEYVIVPNAVPKTDGTSFNMENIMSTIASIAKSSIDDTGKVNLDLLQNGRFGINEVNSFKFREECLRTRSGNFQEDEAKAMAMYELLAGELANDNS